MNRRRWAMSARLIGVVLLLAGLLVTCGAVFGLTPIAHGAEGDLFRKGPYLVYTGDNTRMTVMWQTVAAVDGASLEWGYTTAYEQGSLEVDELFGDENGYLFRQDLTALTPGSLVYYRVMIAGQAFPGSFRAAPADGASSATLYAISDTQEHPETYSAVVGALLRDMAEAPATRQTLCLHGGDFVEAGEDEGSWDQGFFTRRYPEAGEFLATFPVMGALGNHEGYAVLPEDDDDAKMGLLLRKYWPGLFSVSDSSYYYSFDYGPVHVAVVDTWTCAFGAGSVEYEWLADDLSATTKRWKIVMLHNPPYPVGWGRSGAGLIRQSLCPLFEAEDVNVVVSGHNHLYARCEVGGVEYLTIGGAGGELDDSDTSAQGLAASARQHHFLRLDVNGGTLRGTVEDIEGRVLDSFALETSFSDLSPAALAAYRVTAGQVAEISGGYADGAFRPSQTISRAQFAKMAAARFAIEPVTPALPSFSDVPAGHFYHPFIEGAFAAGLVDGVGDGRFAPDSPVSREQAIAVIARRMAATAQYDLDAMTEAQIAGALSPFADSASVSPSLRDEMAYAVLNHITEGTADGRLAPAASLVRLAAAALLIRAGAAPLT